VPNKQPVYLNCVERVELDTMCSWCGVNVPTETQQTIHTTWHRAVGVVPLDAQSQDEPL
jgi:hypothetical protein